MELIIATHNLHKIREFKEMFKAIAHLQLVSLHQFAGYISPEETGSTFKQNAILKAEHAAKALGAWVLADDSGLIVPALRGESEEAGEPGVRSRRYAGPNATDLENRAKLLSAMRNLHGQARSAYFTCALALANPLGVQRCVEGICEGVIVSEDRGRNGFGYDSLFMKYDYDKTFAELDESIKNRISHRRKAFERIVNYLNNLENLSS